MCHIGFRRLSCAALSLAIAASIVACGKSTPVEVPVVQPEGETAAVINDEKLYVADVELEAVARGLIAPGTDFDRKHPDYKMVLDQMIDQKLMAQEAVRRGLDQDPAAQRRLAMAEERILGNLLVENLVASEVTEETIDKMYAEQVKLQQEDDEVSISHIRLESREMAENVHERLLAGEAFELLAKTESTDSSTQLENGDLGYVRPNDLPEAFSVAIADTVTGNISEPFKAGDAWHIIKVKDRRTSPPATRDEMRPEIVTFLTFNEISRLLRRLRTEATIQEGETGVKITPSTPYSLPERGPQLPTQPLREEGSPL